MIDAPRAPYEVKVEGTPGLVEFPMSVISIFSQSLCLFGGGYLRLFPWWVINRSANGVIGQNRPVIFYIHPREIDPEHPRLPMSRLRAFKSYVGLRTTQTKVERILERFQPVTFEEFLKQHWNSFASGELSKSKPASVLCAGAGD
jgi:hypothetical protein